ncbi:MAG: rhomboid family intramembrane serine protease [Oligoflexales bacterium]
MQKRFPVTLCLLAVNTVLFLLVSWFSSSFLVPDSEVLLNFGARDTVLLARGDVWRLLTAGFIHIGLIHFAVNQLALHYLGPQIEELLGSLAFLIVYLFCIVTGNILGSSWSFSTGAGASTALFGLLGVGCFFEHGLGKKIDGPFWKMFLLNSAIGLVIPGLDQAGHFGGWVAGYVIGAVALCSKFSARWKRWLPVALLGLCLTGVGFFYQGQRLLSINDTAERLESLWSGRDKDDEAKSYRILTDVLRLSPENSKGWLRRGVWFLEQNYLRDAYRDFMQVIQIDGDDELLQVQQEFWASEGKVELAMKMRVIREQIEKL